MQNSVEIASFFDPIRALAGGVIFISSYLPAFILRTLSPMSSI